jgi:hypothetical protein
LSKNTSEETKLKMLVSRRRQANPTVTYVGKPVVVKIRLDFQSVPPILANVLADTYPATELNKVQPINSVVARAPRLAGDKKPRRAKTGGKLV